MLPYTAELSCWRGRLLSIGGAAAAERIYKSINVLLIILALNKYISLQRRKTERERRNQLRIKPLLIMVIIIVHDGGNIQTSKMSLLLNRTMDRSQTPVLGRISSDLTIHKHREHRAPFY